MHTSHIFKHSTTFFDFELYMCMDFITCNLSRLQDTFFLESSPSKDSNNILLYFKYFLLLTNQLKCINVSSSLYCKDPYALTQMDQCFFS